VSLRDRGLAVLCGAMFVSAIDMTIVNAARGGLRPDQPPAGAVSAGPAVVGAAI